MKLTDKEISALLDKSAEVRYRYSIKRIADADCLWTIISNNSRYRTVGSIRNLHNLHRIMKSDSIFVK